MAQKKVLIIYYSYSSQTRKLIQAFASGLEGQGINVYWQQLKPKQKLQFPLGSINATIKMMVETFFRRRIAIEPVDNMCQEKFDLIVLAGPTWSYNPSGPVLSFFDDYGDIFQNNKVLPFISCRGYWRVHFWQLRHMLRRRKAQVLDPVVFLHTGPEPWRTIGVFLKMAGKVPESGRSWISRYYLKFGHTREQVDYAQGLGGKFGERLAEEAGVEEIRIDAVGEV